MKSHSVSVIEDKCYIVMIPDSHCWQNIRFAV